MKELKIAVQQIGPAGLRNRGRVSGSNVARKLFALMAQLLPAISFTAAFAHEKKLIVRFSEIQVVGNYLEQYKQFLQEEAEASVRLEQGVIVISPMYLRESDTEFRIFKIHW